MDCSFSKPLRFSPVDLTLCNCRLLAVSSLGPSGAQSTGALAKTTPTHFPMAQKRRSFLTRSIMANDTEQMLTHMDDSLNVVTDGNISSKAPHLLPPSLVPFGLH